MWAAYDDNSCSICMIICYTYTYGVTEGFASW